MEAVRRVVEGSAAVVREVAEVGGAAAVMADGVGLRAGSCSLATREAALKEAAARRAAEARAAVVKEAAAGLVAEEEMVVAEATDVVAASEEGTAMAAA